MSKICLNTRDELMVIDLDQLAYLESDGNYTNMQMISGQKSLLSLGIGKLEMVLKTAGTGAANMFIRLGRKLIINQKYVFQISVPRQKLVLSDMQGHIYSLSVPKPLLKDYKELMRRGFQKPGTDNPSVSFRTDS